MKGAENDALVVLRNGYMPKHRVDLFNLKVLASGSKGMSFAQKVVSCGMRPFCAFSRT